MLEHYSTRVLPSGLEFLAELAFDLRWTYNHKADELFKMLDPYLWELTHNPWLILQTVPLDHLKALSAKKEFTNDLETIKKEWKDFDHNKTWFKQNYKNNNLKSVAYFSMEYGIDESLPLYAGGLGILAGDYLKTAEDLGVPIIGIGILFQKGYFRQTFDKSGGQIEVYPYNDPHSLPVVPLRNKAGEWLRISIQLPERTIVLRIWFAKIGNTHLYLLDSNDPVNLPVDRGITGDLYEAGKEIRLIQEMILGIGGFRILNNLNIDFNLCHMNEGHAAFVVLERIYNWMNENNSNDFWQALSVTRAGNIFTTHTPISAGFDTFDPSLIRNYLAHYVTRCNIDLEDFINLGKIDPENSDEPFNMAYFAIRGSNYVNAVSKIHKEVSKKLFSPLFNRWPVDEIPVAHITNAVHTPTWISPESDLFWNKYDNRLLNEKCSSGLCNFIIKISDSEIWEFRMKNRLYMIDEIKKHIERMNVCCNLPDRLKPFLDPNALYIGFARRFAPYKRLNLLLNDKERLRKILKSSNQPVRIFIGGKAHPSDNLGKQLIKEWVEFTYEPDLHDKIFFLYDYDMDVAQHITGGIDLWLNFMKRPLEASGTSGMKILSNGGLNCSVIDGWWGEAYSEDVGWAMGAKSDSIDSIEYYNDDKADANALYELLENSIIPEFYNRDKKGIPIKWVAKIRQSMSRLTPMYSTYRMMQEYIEKAYLPLSDLYKIRCANNGEIAKQINEWKEKLNKNWEGIHICIPNFENNNNKDFFNVKCIVWLGAIEPKDIKVELYAYLANKPLVTEMKAVSPVSGTINGFTYEAAVSKKIPPDDYTIRIIPNHPDVNVPLEFNKILWQK